MSLPRLQKWQVSFLRMATGVVPATTSPMPKSVLRNSLEKIIQCNRARNISQCVYISSVGNVWALYMLPWILAIVGGIVVLMPFLVTPPAQ